MSKEKHSQSDLNWQEYKRLMENGELTNSIGDYGGFLNGKYLGSESTERKLKKKLEEEILVNTGEKGRLYITMIGLEFEDVVKKEMRRLLGYMIETAETGNEKGILKKLNKSYGKMERMLEHDPLAVPDPEYYQCRQLIIKAAKNEEMRGELISEAKSMLSGITKKENFTQ